MLGLLFGGGPLTKAIMIGSLTLLLLTGGIAALKNREVNSLQAKNVVLTTDNEILKQNNVTLKAAVKDVTDANSANLTTIKQLVEERKDSQAAIESLARSQAKDKDALKKASAKIDEMIKNPANEGKVAPVLAETIRDIQARNKK